MRIMIVLSSLASVNSLVGPHTSRCYTTSSIRRQIGGGDYKTHLQFFSLRARTDGDDQQINGPKAKTDGEAGNSTTNGEQPTLIPQSVYDIDLLTEESKTSLFNLIPQSVYDIDLVPEESRTSIFNLFEMTPYDYYRATRLVQGRSYARNTAFQKENINELPNLQDLSSPKQSTDRTDRLWSTTAFRCGVFLVAFFAFPPIVQFLNFQETIPLSSVSELTDNFSTGVSILYGTLISLTLNILYERQKCISEQIATESSLLVILTRNALALSRNDEENMMVAGKCIMDQVRILVKESRGKELMTMIYADPYGRLLDLVNLKQSNNNSGENGVSLLVFIV